MIQMVVAVFNLFIVLLLWNKIDNLRKEFSGRFDRQFKSCSEIFVKNKNGLVK